MFHGHPHSTQEILFFAALRQFQNLGHFLADGGIVFSSVGPQTAGAVFDTSLRVLEAAAAFVTQTVKGAIAKQAAEGLGIGTCMTGEIFAGFMLEKVVVVHGLPCLSFQKSVQGYVLGGS